MIHAPIIIDEARYRKGTSNLSADKLVKDHYNLVRRIAWQIQSGMSSAIPVEDLIQIGLIALVEAARCFEERGAPFTPYASTRIRGAMIDQLRKEAHIGRKGVANKRRLVAVRKQLECELGGDASDAEMASAMGMEAEDYFALVNSSESLQFDSLNEVYSDSNLWFIDLSGTPEEDLAQRQVEQLLAEAIANLDKRSALVLQLYFKEGLNLTEIAETLDVSAPRVCQIKKEALDQLRNQLKEIIDL